MEKNRMYPELIIPNNTNPNKLYAFPIIGITLKLIMLIPVFIVSTVLGFVYAVLSLITPFVILFTGKYWNTAYTFTLGYFIYSAKVQLFLAGITDKYPGFNLETNGIFEIHLPKPTSPSRLLGFPLLGYAARTIVMIPYYFYLLILDNGSYVAIVASWFGVWIKGIYPESLYEFNKDDLRVSLAYLSYTTYISDTYPSFRISLNHKVVKIILITIGALYMIYNISSSTQTIQTFVSTMEHPTNYIAPAPTYGN